MKIYGEVKLQLPTFLTSALEGGEQSASHPSCFTSPRERASPPPPYHFDRMMYGP